MAKVIGEKKSIHIEDGSSMIKPCEQLGIPFGCRVGDCQICKIKILKGAENLSHPTAKEQGLPKDVRLACQCNIIKGEVKLKRCC